MTRILVFIILKIQVFKKATPPLQVEEFKYPGVWGELGRILTHGFLQRLE